MLSSFPLTYLEEFMRFLSLNILISDPMEKTF